MSLTSRRAPITFLFVLLAVPITAFGCASSASRNHPVVPTFKVTTPPRVGERVVVIVEALRTDNLVSVEEEYVSKLRQAISKEWQYSSTELSEAVSFEFVLGWDAGIVSIRLKSKRENGIQASKVLEAVLRAHRSTLSGDFRLFIERDDQRERCLACLASLVITLEPLSADYPN